jgi:hypothetical protein
MLKRMPKKSGVALALAAFVLSLFFMPSPVLAAWHDNSPKGTDMTPVLIVGGIVVAACVVYLIVKHNNKAKDGDEQDKGESKSSGAVIGKRNLILANSGATRPSVFLQQGDKETRNEESLVAVGGASNPCVNNDTNTSSVSLRQGDIPKLDYYLRVESNQHKFSSEGGPLDLANITVKAGLTFGF